MKFISTYAGDVYKNHIGIVVKKTTKAAWEIHWFMNDNKYFQDCSVEHRNSLIVLSSNDKLNKLIFDL